jgi:hypothetical protein
MLSESQQVFFILSVEQVHVHLSSLLQLSKVWYSTFHIPIHYIYSSKSCSLYRLVFILVCILYFLSWTSPAHVIFALAVAQEQGVTKRCRLSWMTNSALVYEPKCGGRGGVAGSQPMSTAVHRSPNKLWRSNSIFNLCSGGLLILLLSAAYISTGRSQFSSLLVEISFRLLTSTHMLKKFLSFSSGPVNSVSFLGCVF